jgi:HEAT repeat protein
MRITYSSKAALMTFLVCAIFVSILCCTGISEASGAEAERAQVRLPLVTRRAAAAELKDARQLLRKYWAVREGSSLDSPLVLAAFEKAVSAFRAVSEKYARTDIDSQALIGLFKLFQFAGDEKRSNEIVDAIFARFGPEFVSDAYFELGLDYLQRAHDPRHALESFKKIPMPSAPDATDTTPEGMHEYEQARRTYLRVQQPMAKCEVQLGEPEKAERRYNKLIELFPELKESLQRSLVFEVKSIATRRPRNKYWLSLSGLKQKLYQRSAAEWLEDFEMRQAQIEEERWGREVGGLRCSIEIKPAEIRVGGTLAIDVEIKNVSSNNITLYYQDLYQAEKLIIKNEQGDIVSSIQTAVYNWPNPKKFFRLIKVGQTFTEQFKGRVVMKFIRAKELPHRTAVQPLLIDFRDVAQHILQPGRFTAALQLTTDERIVKMGTNFGFSEIWTGELVSNEAEFSVRRMRRDELNRVIDQLRSGSEEQRAEAIEVIKANKDRQAVRELTAILVSGKGSLHKVSSALIQIQDISILPDLLELYRVSARYSKNERGEHQRYILQTIHGLEADQHKMDTLFIKIVKSEDPIAARSYAASYLGMGDNPETVAALIEAANKEPVQVQRSAIDALGRIGSRLKVGDKHTIIEPLVEIMRTRSERTIRQRAVSALGQVGSNSVVPFLIEALGDRDLFVGAAASSYLGRYAGPEAIEALEKYLGQAETESQKRAAGDAIKFIKQRSSSNQ